MSLRFKYVISLLLTASILGSMLIFPAFASGLTAVLNIAASPISGQTSYLLGETIFFTGMVSFTSGESTTLQSVTLVINGPQPFSKQLPVQAGTYSYPADRLTVTVTYNNVTLTGVETIGYGYGYGDGYGYGYGYGYSLQAGAQGGSINYAIQWRPPYLLTDPAAELPEVDLAWQIPSVTGMSATRKPQGIASDGTNLYLLVDGTSSDIIVKTNTDGTVLTSFNAPNKDTRAIAYLDGFLYVYADNYQRIIAVTTETPTYESWESRPYKLSIADDWNKQLADRNGDGFVNENDITVTVDGQSWSAISLDVWNERFQIDDSSVWDRQKVQGPTVVKVGSTYHMWYYSDSGAGEQEKIGHATSSDGLAWTKDASNPVLSPGASGAWDEAGVLHPSVVYDSATSTYHMWYIGRDSGGTDKVGYATSSNGSTWTKHANNPVFSASADNPNVTTDWDQTLYDMDVIASSSYQMFYSAAGPTIILESQQVWNPDTFQWDTVWGYVSHKEWKPHIGRATSSDGVNWTRDSYPVLHPSDWDFDQNGLRSPTVLKDGTDHYMFYQGIGWSADERKIGRAKSTDGGATWTKPSSSSVLDQGSGSDFDSRYVHSPDVILDGTAYRMWYEGVDWNGKAAIGRAAGVSKGASWTKHSANPHLKPGVEGAAIRVSYSYNDGYPQNSIIKIETDGDYVNHYQSPSGGTTLGGLTTDGTSLYGSSKDWGDVWKVDPDDGSVEQSKNFYSWDKQWTNGADALAYKSGKLYAAKGDVIAVLNWSNQSVEDTYDLSGVTDIGGLEFIGNTLYIGAANVGTIYKSGLPGTVEGTTIGSYTAKLQAVNGGTVASPTVSFTLTKLTVPVDVEITNPAQGDAFFTPTITIEGTVNDASIHNVSIGVELPMTELLSDDMESGDSVTGSGEFQKQNVSGTGSGVSYSTENLWHLSEERANSDDWSWAYHKESGDKPNYDTPNKANAGAIVSNEFTVGQDATLSFWTSYDTGPGPEWDRKLVDIFVNSQWRPLAYIVDGTWYWDPYGGQREVVVVPMAWMMPFTGGAMFFPPGEMWNWYEVDLDLSAYTGETVKLRFFFDTIDSWDNWFEGWYIDDVVVTGAGFQGTTAAVTNLSFSAEFTLAEGYNDITVTGQSGYIPGNNGRDSDTVTVSLDNTAPIVTLDALPGYTNAGSVTVSGTVEELNFVSLELTINKKTFYTLRDVPSGQSAPEWTFSAQVALFEGVNEIVATVTDVPGLTGTDSATIIRDSTGPDIAVLATVYPTGEVSARANDMLIFQVNIVDPSAGVDHVALVTPGGAEEDFIPAGDLPEALRDQWGTSGEYLFPVILPSTPPGPYSLTVKAYDRAGNVSTATVSAWVVATLSAYNIYLMPEWNLISLPLIPDDGDIPDLLGSVLGVESVWYYDAASGTWKVYSTGPAPDNLTTMETGKGYWVSMDGDVFDYSDPLAAGMPETPAPIKFSYTGKVLKPATVPPTYILEEGWNAIGLHSEWSKPVTQYLLPVSVPEQVWAALLQYDNYIKFTIGEEEGGAEIYLGSFRTLLSTDYMEPGRGFWLYLVQSGKIVAQP